MCVALHRDRVATSVELVLPLPLYEIATVACWRTWHHENNKVARCDNGYGSGTAQQTFRLKKIGMPLNFLVFAKIPVVPNHYSCCFRATQSCGKPIRLDGHGDSYTIILSYPFTLSEWASNLVFTI